MILTDNSVLYYLVMMMMMMHWISEMVR